MKGTKIILLGIVVILFGFSWVNELTLSCGVIGLLLAIIGLFVKDK